MVLRVAFVGFRHAHVFGLYHLCRERPDIEIAGVCEEDTATRNALADRGVPVTHTSYAAMLADVSCDIVACADVYALRGGRLIAALRAGKHVLADKPICTNADELNEIERLARAGQRSVGAMLDVPDMPPFRTLRRLIRAGTIGDIHTVSFAGQHPLNYGTRPAWYFEPGMHGGTINDIAIHAVDALAWMTGLAVVEVTAARAWNARLTCCPHFQDAAVLLLRLANEAAVMGDVSYLAPEGAKFPYYWRYNISGSDGHLETWIGGEQVTIFRKGQATGQEEPLDAARPGGYLEDFLAEIAGIPNPDGLCTARVLRSSRVALAAQRAADTGRFPVPV